MNIFRLWRSFDQLTDDLTGRFHYNWWVLIPLSLLGLALMFVGFLAPLFIAFFYENLIIVGVSIYVSYLIIFPYGYFLMKNAGDRFFLRIDATLDYWFD